MPKKQNDPRRLLIISSPSPTGDADGPPDLDSAHEGPLALVRSLRENGSWPDSLDLLIVSDSYGLVEPDSSAGWPVPIPFTRPENPDWWAGFISRNLDNHITRHPPDRVFILFEPVHEPAFRAANKLRNLDVT